MLNTRFDYEYIKNHNQPGWQQHWFDLLDGRWIIEDNELVEDANAKIFRIGFTVNDIEVAIGQAGYLPRQVKWYTSQPERYALVDGVYMQAEDWQAKQASRIAEEELSKQKDIIAAQRYAIETGGVIEPVSGKTILTDRESQQILDSTIEKIRRGLVPSVRWKCKDGWLTLNTNNIDDIEILCLTHVQTAFAWEEAEQVRLGLV